MFVVKRKSLYNCGGGQWSLDQCDAKRYRKRKTAKLAADDNGARIVRLKRKKASR